MKNGNMGTSLGINIGSLNTVYSKFDRNEGLYKTNVLLSDVSKRVIPSQIGYSDTKRLYGDTASSLMRKFADYSYSNLSRLIGFDIDSYIFKNEYNNFFNFGTYNNATKKFKISNNEEISSSIIIADFISLINKFYFDKVKKEENEKYDFVTFSVPDYFTAFQKQELKLIAQAIGMKDINIITESSAITMYYGYNKYRDMFVSNKINVDTTIIKYVLFIDIGYSKMNIIFSIFKHAKFTVEYVKSYPDFGGRDFDNKMMEYCLNDFKKNHPNIPQDKELLNLQLKIRFLESIDKGRKSLTINKDTTIVVESFYENQDLECKITKKEFETLIVKSELDKFENYLSSFKNDLFKNGLIDKNKLPEDLIIEMAGEFMRTPILQNITERVFNISISKGILVDECTSVGAALYGYYINRKLPISTFKNIYSYNYYIIQCHIPEINKSFKVKDFGCDFNYKIVYSKVACKDLKEKSKITLLYYELANQNYFSPKNDSCLCEYELSLDNLKEYIEKYKYMVLLHSCDSLDTVTHKIYFTNSDGMVREGVFDYDSIKKANIQLQQCNTALRIQQSKVGLHDEKYAVMLQEEIKSLLYEHEVKDAKYFESVRIKNETDNEIVNTRRAIRTVKCELEKFQKNVQIKSVLEELDKFLNDVNDLEKRLRAIAEDKDKKAENNKNDNQEIKIEENIDKNEQKITALSEFSKVIKPYKKKILDRIEEIKTTYNLVFVE